ncbi:MAG TPA: DUF302 domain-containing protein [Bryobacteraceae bacterium]|nr:DUF302 domain-containing protein [Bryobacteraceae bacterium]
MLQMRSTVGWDQIESAVRSAAHRHGASLTVVSHLGQPQREALVFTLYHAKCYTALLEADIRFAGFLPCRVAAWQEGDGVTLQAFTPSEYCRILDRPDLEPAAAPLDDVLKSLLDDATRPHAASARTRSGAGPSHWGATEDQVNMRAALPQRIDYRGTKVEDEAGTGQHDSPGG